MSARATRRGDAIVFECPGCRYSLHSVYIEKDRKPCWGWNGSLDRPTFTPSILVRGTVPITDAERDRILAGETIEPRPFVCHSFVTDGRISYCSDSTHALSGQTVDLPEIEP